MSLGLLVSNPDPLYPGLCVSPSTTRHWQVMQIYDPTGSYTGTFLNGQSVQYHTVSPYDDAVPDGAVLAPLVLAFYQPRLIGFAQGQYDGPNVLQNPHPLNPDSMSFGISVEWNGEVVYEAAGGGYPAGSPGDFFFDLPGLTLDSGGYANVANLGPYAPDASTPYVLVRQDVPPLPFGQPLVAVTFSISGTYADPPDDATHVIRRPFTVSNPLIPGWIVAAAST